MKSLKYLLFILMLSTSVNGSVITNEIAGQQYDWLSIDTTLGVNRNSVEAMLLDSSSAVYGYQYASRSLVASLFTSYASWDGVNDYHSDPAVVLGISNLFNDFGLSESTFRSDAIYAYYGLDGQCSADISLSCSALLETFYLPDMTLQDATFGWDPNNSQAVTATKDGLFDNGSLFSSFLVKQSSIAPLPSTVPVPAAAWLFGSALLGFFGFSRRKNNA